MAALSLASLSGGRETTLVQLGATMGYAFPSSDGFASEAGFTFALAPLVAPLIGGTLQTMFGWRSNFVLLFGVGVYVMFSLLATLAPTFETLILARIGQGLAFLLGFIGLFGNPMLVFIAIFVYVAAAGEAQQTVFRDAVRGLSVTDAMETGFAKLEAGATLAIPGLHNVRNAVAAAAAATAAGAHLERVAQGLAAFRAVDGRLQRKAGLHGAVVLDDTYNANPDSVRAAIDVLAAQPAPRWLALGDMGEVGDHGAEYHAEIGAYAKAQGIERLYCMGSAMRDAALAYGPGALHFDAIEPLIDAVRMAPPEVSLLVKGSRFMRMERVVGALIGEPVEPHGASPEKKPVAPEGAGAREGHDHVA